MKNTKMRDLAFEGARRIFGAGPEAAVMNRLEHEFGLFEKKGVIEQVRALYDLAQWAATNGIIIYHRGSAICSLLFYCLGITNINPLEYGLDFDILFHEDKKQLRVTFNVDFDSFPKMIEYISEEFKDIFTSLNNHECYALFQSVLFRSEGPGTPVLLQIMKSSEVTRVTNCIKIIERDGYRFDFNDIDLDNPLVMETIADPFSDIFLLRYDAAVGLLEELPELTFEILLEREIARGPHDSTADPQPPSRRPNAVAQLTLAYHQAYLKTYFPFEWEEAEEGSPYRRG